ncbi:MAG TPA: CpXC domain-containing protein [Kofleriaceae bacterium]|nr:CpXC domain-containing protein [Kofleriaceae bacterium]
MSEMTESGVTCPRCRATWTAGLFTSVDADTIQVQVEAILEGRFERMACPCGHAFRPEHRMLFVSHERRLWIVMHPLAERPGFATLERDVAQVIAAGIARAAPATVEELHGIRPRLVFGQHMLSEAVRVAYAGLDAAMLECAKLLTVRRNLAALIKHGPFELCFERLDGKVPTCGVISLPAGERVGEMAIAVDVWEEVQDHRTDLEASFPEIFAGPYMSATRYLLAATV